MQQGQGPAAVAGVSDTVKKVGDRLLESNIRLRTALAKAGQEWTGVAAQRLQQSANAAYQALDDATDDAGKANTQIAYYRDSFAATKPKIPPPREKVGFFEALIKNRGNPIAALSEVTVDQYTTLAANVMADNEANRALYQHEKMAQSSLEAVPRVPAPPPIAVKGAIAEPGPQPAPPGPSPVPPPGGGRPRDIGGGRDVGGSALPGDGGPPVPGQEPRAPVPLERDGQVRLDRGEIDQARADVSGRPGPLSEAGGTVSYGGGGPGSGGSSGAFTGFGPMLGGGGGGGAGGGVPSSPPRAPWAGTAPVPGGAPGTGAGPSGGGMRPGGSAGSLLQPAVGGAGNGEDDQEHSNRFWQKNDDIFGVDDLPKVAPPVIGE
ncbi:hypothetical protein [Allokutzneria oryzae]|uniref:PPE domain-containing protein n=1 Tax=Allokutzneria oryzae TaxID=1378989 RepID=A0ABV5ZRP5_9PSEU